MFWVFLAIALVLLATLYLVLSVRIIGPTEIAIITRLGRPVRVVESGLVVVWRFLENVILGTTKQLRLDYEPRKVQTKKKEYRGEEYEAAEVEIDPTVYFRLPRDRDDLIEALEALPVFPSTADEESAELVDLYLFFEDEVHSAVRGAAGSVSWIEILNANRSIEDQAAKLLLEGGPFKSACISDVRLSLEVTQLPPALRDLISQPQEERLRKRGMVEKAEGERADIRQRRKGYGWGPLGAFLSFLDRKGG